MDLAALNFQHLRYFWTVARVGNLTRASVKDLQLAPQTVSAQIRELEHALGVQLFQRRGRNLVLTEVGEMVLRYADDIFALGRELAQVVRGGQPPRSMRLVVGISDAMPKLVAHRLMEPAMRLDPPGTLVCREGPSDELIGRLATHELDVVLADSPVPGALKVRAYSHLLGECGVTIMARPDLSARYPGPFPERLNDAPLLLPTGDAVLRRELDRWLRAHALRPMIRGEFQDSALLKVFGQEGRGFFPVPSVIAAEVARQYGVEAVGVADGVVERFYAISVERKVRHGAVAAICDAARSGLFGSASAA